MNLVREIKCIMCLIKCSKYLYFAKKILCFLTIVIASVTLVTIAGADSGDMAKKLKGMM